MRQAAAGERAGHEVRAVQARRAARERSPESGDLGLDVEVSKTDTEGGGMTTEPREAQYRHVTAHDPEMQDGATAVTLLVLAVTFLAGVVIGWAP